MYLIRHFQCPSLFFSGPHILQRMQGCEWDDETEDIKGFNQYGYNGEDFISFDLETLRWVAPKQEAEITKHRWNTDRARLEFNKNFYIHVCPKWLKKYMDYGRYFQQRTGKLVLTPCLEHTNSKHFK